MKQEQKNLIFQFIEELYSENKGKEEIRKKEEEIYIKLERLEAGDPSLKNEVSNIINLISSLYSDVKYRYFEYGIIARTVKDTTNLKWTEK